ncbi:hypothetical protein EON63_15985, partial [archaeon]
MRGHASGEESVVHFFLPTLQDKVNTLIAPCTSQLPPYASSHGPTPPHPPASSPSHAHTHAQTPPHTHIHTHTQCALLSRFLFLTHYLLVSDHTSVARITTIVDILYSWVLGLADMKDTSVLSMKDTFLLGVVQTQYGYERCLESGSLEIWVQARLTKLEGGGKEGDGDEGEGDVQEERDRCMQLLDTIYHPKVIYPHTHTHTHTHSHGQGGD